MIALLKKDWRVFRVVVVGGVILTCVPYLILAAVIVFSPHRTPEQWPIDVLLGTARIALVLTAVVASVFGGAAFAVERRERSADFLATLPVSRMSIILSKFLVAWFCTGCIGLLHLWIGQIALQSTRWDREDEAVGLLVIFGAGCMMFGIGWLCSTFMSSPAIATAISIVVTFSMVVVIEQIDERLGPYSRLNEYLLNEYLLLLAAGMAMLAVGLASTIAGSVYYLRRVAP